MSLRESLSARPCELAVATVNERLLASTWPALIRNGTRSVAGLQAVYGRNVFPAMKVTYGSYPDQRGHLTATGCFRCHDGSHTDAAGAEIPSDCETCHKDVTPAPAETSSSASR